MMKTENTMIYCFLNEPTAPFDRKVFLCFLCSQEDFYWSHLIHWAAPVNKYLISVSSAEMNKTMLWQTSNRRTPLPLRSNIAQRNRLQILIILYLSKKKSFIYIEVIDTFSNDQKRCMLDKNILLILSCLFRVLSWCSTTWDELTRATIFVKPIMEWDMDLSGRQSGWTSSVSILHFLLLTLLLLLHTCKINTWLGKVFSCE